MAKKQNTKKKSLLALALVCLLMCTTLLGTMAWLSAKSELINTFTVGDIRPIDCGTELEPGNGPIDINNPNFEEGELIEIPKDDPSTPENESEKNLNGNLMEPSWVADSKLVPGNVIAKDPYVGIGADSEPAYAYIYVTNTMPAIKSVYFEITDEWTYIDWTGSPVKDESGNVIGYADGLFRYNEILEAAEDNEELNVWTKTPLFYDVIVANGATKEDLVCDDEVGAIKVESYVHQAYGDSQSEEIGTEVCDRKMIQNILDKERYKRFNKLLEEKFTDAKLLLILDNFKNRKTSNDEYDEVIKKLVSSNADGPTSFEYILAIIWYKISDCQGDIFNFMNLSLDADLLPKTHAGGGVADIVWKYEKSDCYPKHDLLIEATLTDATNQRRMEMEPVSRHLGEYLCENGKSMAYCIFITNYLNMNVISDFRMRKNQPYYGNNGNKILGMNITPLETDLLKIIIQKNLKYKTIYSVIKDEFESCLEPKEWYEEFGKKIKNINL